MDIKTELDYRDVELLSKILYSRPLSSISSISRSLDKSKSSISRRLRKLEKKGFKFTVDIDYWAIGLRIKLAILSGYKNIKNIDRRFLYSITRLIPNNTMISYYEPILEGKQLAKVFENSEDCVDADEVYGSRPDLNKYFNVRDNKIVLNKNDLLKNIMDSVKSSNKIVSEIKNIEKIKSAGKAKITEMDIRIVSILEEHGIISPNAIAEKLGLKKSRVLKRLAIISRYIKSVSLKETPWGRKLPLIIVSSVKTREPRYARSIVSVISRHPLHRKTYLSSMTGEFITLFYANSSIAELIAELFNDLSDKSVVNYYMTWATTSKNWKEFKLVEGPRYSKYIGTWVKKRE